MTDHATETATRRYADRMSERAAPGHFHELVPGVQASTIGIGTYLGDEDAATDAQYRRAIRRAVERGINVIDTAVNYRQQRSERVIAAALADLAVRKLASRDELIIATKGGFIPLDAADPRDPKTYFTETYLASGIVQPDEVVGGVHCMAPRYLEDQIDRSRLNLGIDTIDVYYVHNPETQLEGVDRDVFLRRIREAFAALEKAVADGKIVRYGTATWNGYRQDPGTRGYLSLAELVGVARDVAGEGHHFKVVQLPYNLAMTEAFTRANQVVEGDMITMLQAARRLGIYIMASASVYQGQLTRNLSPVVAEYLPGLETDGQRALQFVRSTPGIGTALVGMKSLAHVDENTAVARVAPLAWFEFQRLFSQA
ncbi:MAG: aldo/keto reductase [Candidatus Rokubacteria bacterium]|nr:aldo/keto reductase [Candidatus Rokubacteria bacterium]